MNKYSFGTLRSELEPAIGRRYHFFRVIFPHRSQEGASGDARRDAGEAKEGRVDVSDVNATKLTPEQRNAAVPRTDHRRSGRPSVRP